MEIHCYNASPHGQSGEWSVTIYGRLYTVLYSGVHSAASAISAIRLALDTLEDSQNATEKEPHPHHP